jgi:hypothetical protein
VQFGCAFPGQMRFQFHFQCQKLKNDIKNAFDRETHIQTAHPKRKCNRPLNDFLFLNSISSLDKLIKKLCFSSHPDDCFHCPVLTVPRERSPPLSIPSGRRDFDCIQREPGGTYSKAER